MDTLDDASMVFDSIEPVDLPLDPLVTPWAARAW